MHARLSTVLAATTVALLLSTAPALSEVYTFSATLTGAAEVPPNESTGTGMVSADYDTETKLFKWVISYEGLSGPATAAHFHGPAGPEEVADPVIPVDLAPAPSAGAAAGTETATPTEAEPEAAAEAGAEAPAEAAPERPPEPTEPTTPAETQPQAPADAAQPEAPAAAEPEADAAAETEAEAEPEVPAAGAEPAAEDEAPSATQITGEATLTDEQAEQLRSGMWYFNIHTAMYPDGELRGQLPPYAE